MELTPFLKLFPLTAQIEVHGQLYILPLNQSPTGLVKLQVLTTASMRWPSSELVRSVLWQKFTDISEVLTASIISAIDVCDLESSVTWEVVKAGVGF
jgi:hypothetical protein